MAARSLSLMPMLTALRVALGCGDCLAMVYS
jgi:hypothetical protein